MNAKTKILSVGACLVTMFCIGIVYLWSVFQQPVIDHYGWSSSAVTMVSSAIIFCYVLGTLIGGYILDRTSPSFVAVIGGVLLSIGLYLTSLLGPAIPWLIYITYGLCAGFGVAILFFALGGGAVGREASVRAGRRCVGIIRRAIGCLCGRRIGAYLFGLLGLLCLTLYSELPYHFGASFL